MCRDPSCSSARLGSTSDPANRFDINAGDSVVEICSGEGFLVDAGSTPRPCSRILGEGPQLRGELRHRESFTASLAQDIHLTAHR